MNNYEGAQERDATPESLVPDVREVIAKITKNWEEEAGEKISEIHCSARADKAWDDSRLQLADQILSKLQSLGWGDLKAERERIASDLDLALEISQPHRLVANIELMIEKLKGE